MGKVLRTRAGYPVAVPNPAHRAVPTVISVAMHHSARLSFCEILGRPAEGPCELRAAGGVREHPRGQRAPCYGASRGRYISQ